MGSLSLTLALKNRRSRLSPALPQKYERVSPNLNKTHGFYGILWRSQRLNPVKNANFSYIREFAKQLKALFENKESQWRMEKLTTTSSSF